MEILKKNVGEGGGGRDFRSRTPVKTIPRKPAPKKKPTTPTPTKPKPSTPIPAPATPTGMLTYEQWYAKYGKQGSWATPGIGDGKTTNPKNAYEQGYKATYKPPVTPKPTAPVGPVKPGTTQVVPGTAVPKTNQMNVANYAGQVATNPTLGLTQDNKKTATNEDMNLSNRVPDINPNAPGTTVNPNDPDFAKSKITNAPTATGGTAAQASQTAQGATHTYAAQQTQANIAQNGQMTAAQGTVSEGAQIDPNEVPQLDMQGSATGVNADGSTNYTGQALNDYAKQNFTNIIDTSTPAGKALAEQLGDGNYTDSKATLQGQLEMLQSQFTDPTTGEPKIPAWAAGTARNVGRIAAFKGMSGTAATAAMSQALMEASIPIAQQDAQFFQTLTLQNLSNKQASVINKANVLAKFDLTNIDNRMAAAVENSKAFLQMDLANLDNRQQAQVLNTQARIQSILEDAKAVNAQRLFTADSANEQDRFYDELNSNIKQFNATQTNNMKQFNASETNDMSKFNKELETNREQFYKNMQYNIDISNAKWRQSVTTEEAAMAFEAAATDVKNMVGISNEQLNRLWDRSDSLLDYLWKSSESELDRKRDLAVVKLQADAQSKMNKANIKAADSAGWGSIFGSIGGAVAGSDKFLDFLF